MESLREEASFSASARSRSLAEAGAGVADLLVIGGGITGVGIAHEAAGRGLEVVLVDGGDFGGGTSSRSSRLIHGGLRYLETYDFRLVFEALGERGRLVRQVPHLVRPLPFLFPVYKGGSVGMWKLRAGMLLYDTLAARQRLHRHRMLGRDAALREEPGLRAEGLRGAARYFDAQVDDARLTVTVARAAHQAGARLISYARVAGLGRDGEGVRVVRVEDQRSGESHELRARLVIAAVGPWTDQLRAIADPGSTPRLRPTKGVHIQLHRERLGNRGAITFRSPLDGRVMFVLPWGEFSYVGTTDTDVSGRPEDWRVTAEDVDYLLRSANALMPDAHLEPSDVLSTWTGVRPLLAPPEPARRLSAGQTSREHDIWREQDGTLFIAGGKLTTFRVMAREAMDEAGDILKREHRVISGFFSSDHAALPGAPDGEWETFLDRTEARGRAAGLPAGAARRLAEGYGTDADWLIGRIGADPSAGDPVHPALPYLWAEVDHAVERECAVTLEDVLRRRLHIFYDSSDGGLEVARTVAERMAAAPGLAWNDADVEGQLDAYAAAVERTRAPGTGAGPA